MEYKIHLLASLLPWAVTVGTVIVLLTLFFCKIRKRKYEWIKYLWIFLLSSYLVILYGVCFVDRGNYQNFRMGMPFADFVEVINERSFYLYVNLVINFIITVPLGFLMPLVFSLFHQLKYIVSLGFFLSTVIEFAQLISHKGIFSFDDIIGNTVGAVIGFGILIVIEYILDKYHHQQIENMRADFSKKNVFRLQIPMMVTVLIFVIIGTIVFWGHRSTKEKFQYYKTQISESISKNIARISEGLSEQDYYKIADILDTKRNIECGAGWVKFECFRDFDGDDLSYYGVIFLDVANKESVLNTECKMEEQLMNDLSAHVNASYEKIISEGVFEYEDSFGVCYCIEKIDDNWYMYSITY